MFPQLERKSQFLQVFLSLYPGAELGFQDMPDAQDAHLKLCVSIHETIAGAKTTVYAHESPCFRANASPGKAAIH